MSSLRRRSFFWSSPEFGGEIPIFRTKIEPVCSADLFFEAHTTFLSAYTKQALRGNVGSDSYQK